MSGATQSVSMRSHRFVPLLDGQQGTVTTAFDTMTEIDQERGSWPLIAGAYIVEVKKQAYGTLSAAEISGSQQGGDDQGTDAGEHGARSRQHLHLAPVTTTGGAPMTQVMVNSRGTQHPSPGALY